MGSASHSSKRKKKRTQKRDKKKSKIIKEKSKKIKLRHDSVSDSDVDDKSASVSSLSGSSSSSEGSYRSRRRTGRKRDTRKVSKKKTRRDSSMSDSSEDSRQAKKRKRSKKSSKKHIEKKKRRRKSYSSFSSDDSDKKTKKKNENKLEKVKERNGSKRSRHSSRSCSPRSLRSESHSYDSDERLMDENPPKRLKSVIVVLREMNETQVEEFGRDVLKEEIGYEHDDYPSRSVDSNDEKMKEPSKEAGGLDVETSEVLSIQRLDVERNVGSNSADLEIMLRQKALENLLKRQGKLRTKIEDGGNQDEHRIYSKVKSPDRGGNSESAREAEMNNDVKHLTIPIDPPTRKPETELYVEKVIAFDNPMISKPKLDLSTSTIRLLGSSNTWRRDPTLQGSPMLNSSTPKETVVQDSPKSIESQPPDTKIVAEKPEQSVISRGESAKAATKEDEDSEFEQKTMTVMRGGELVQVSYKVKIPKKAPALGRRQFKR